jgi:hypothetical protein
VIFFFSQKFKFSSHPTALFPLFLAPAATRGTRAITVAVGPSTEHELRRTSRFLAAARAGDAGQLSLEICGGRSRSGLGGALGLGPLALGRARGGLGGEVRTAGTTSDIVVGTGPVRPPVAVVLVLAAAPVATRALRLLAPTLAAPALALALLVLLLAIRLLVGAGKCVGKRFFRNCGVRN